MHIIPLSLLSCYNDGKGGDDLRVIFKALTPDFSLVVVFSLGVPFCIIFPPYNSNSYLKTFVKIPVF